MITSLITISTLFFCSTAISNGFSPVFAVMGETRKSRLPWISLAIFFACKLAIDLATGVIGFTVIQGLIEYAPLPCPSRQGFFIAKKAALP